MGCAKSLQFQCIAAVTFCGNAVFEMSVSYKLLHFLVALYPPQEKALLFAQNLKLILESLGEGCFLQSVSISLSLLFLCVGWGRQTLPWH